MTISSYYESFHSNSKIQQLSAMQSKEPQKADQMRREQQDSTATGNFDYNAGQIEVAEANKASRFADLENTSLTTNKGESFDYIGNDCSLDNLDMQKAVSGMKKDQVLHIQSVLPHHLILQD